MFAAQQVTRTMNSETHYYTRLEDCKDCSALRGQRCVEDEINLGYTHESRLRTSGMFNDQTHPNRIVRCDTCNVPPGVACRSCKGGIIHKEHLSRRTKVAAQREGELESA